jgi:heat-inducible transcriptional repressor
MKTNPRHLTPREEVVLARVVAQYLETAAPVGSAHVAQTLTAMRQRVSSATVRGVMAELERQGLLTHPHTSAGRMPTPTGLRYFLDCLVETTALEGEAEEQIVKGCQSRDGDVSELLHEVSATLASLSHHVGMVVTPVDDDLVLQHLEFVALSDRRLLGIFVSREGVTENRILHMQEPFESAVLQRINNYCREAFVGLTLSEARHKAAADHAEAQRVCDAIAVAAGELSSTVFDRVTPSAVVMDGERSLLKEPEFSESQKAKALLDALSEKHQILHLMERSVAGDGIHVFIGAESQYDVFQDCSVVVSSYERKGKVLGTLGVIGPTRMAYGRVIPIVRCAAHHVSQWLDQQ